jgi:hypothetical protein
MFVYKQLQIDLTKVIFFTKYFLYVLLLCCSVHMIIYNRTNLNDFMIITFVIYTAWLIVGTVFYNNPTACAILICIEGYASILCGFSISEFHKLYITHNQLASEMYCIILASSIILCLVYVIATGVIFVLSKYLTRQIDDHYILCPIPKYPIALNSIVIND